MVCFALAISRWHSGDPTKFLCYLGVAIAASFLKIKLPGVNGTLSVNFLFVLLGVLELSFGETLMFGIAEVVVQSFWNSSKEMKPIHVVFNASQFSVGTAVAWSTYRLLTHSILHRATPVALILVAMVYFAFNTLAVAIVVRLSEGKPILKIWSESYFWSFPYYLAGAAITGSISFLNRQIGWQSSLLVFPPVYLMYRSYRLYLGKLENEKRHAEQVSKIHLRTIEALALAIEAKDHTTHDHLQRVRVYAMELAKELGLSEDETEALQAAAVLHDIGKLAVPEHIISKPGKLTPQEFEKMKVHPIVGAEILEQVDFPYPVVPIVHAHHEKWDGSGYPDGLKGEAIPIGARILAAVDCLDALASDRQYRRALPLNEAMARVSAEAGKSFDPQIVEILGRRYIEWERMASEEPVKAAAKLSTDIRVERGAAPAAGFAESEEDPVRLHEPAQDCGSAVADARQTGQYLFELSQQPGVSLTLDDTLSMLSVRLKRLVPHDAMAVYRVIGEQLAPVFVSGDNHRLFSSLRIPLGEGLSGWVAHNNKPIVNGNPSVEPGYLNDPTKYSTLRSALAVPVEGDSGVVAVLALYRAQQDGFRRDHVRVLLAVAGKLGFAMQSLPTQDGTDGQQPNTDALTGLPNLRALHGHLEREIFRCRGANTALSIFLCRLEGCDRIDEGFGTAKRNHVLQVFAATVKESCRQPDYVARTGAEEFLVVAPGMRESAAREMTQRLGNIAVQSSKAICGEALLSAEVGHVCDSDETDNAEELVAEAERRLRRSSHVQVPKTLARAAKAGTS
jgi:diguanylate cyclase (GGDEF)-like protein/putative nucleotidyltransferase with HDIG domain